MDEEVKDELKKLHAELEVLRTWRHEMTASLYANFCGKDEVRELRSRLVGLEIRMNRQFDRRQRERGNFGGNQE